MSTIGGGNLITSGLILCLDAANNHSYNGTGLIWYDLTSNLSNASLTGSITYSSSNYGGFQFSGASGSWGTGSINRGNTFSYNIWFKRLELSREQHLIEFYNTQFYVSSSNKLGVASWIAATALAGTTSIVNGQVYNATLTRDGNGASLYLNGILESSTNLSGSNPNVNIYALGQFYNGGNYWFNGFIYSTQIYNRVLSQSEVTQNYNAMKSRFNLS